MPNDSQAGPRRQLTLLDSTSIIVGIIIGSTIYESSPLIASSVPNAWWLMGVWVLGGLLAFCGALLLRRTGYRLPSGRRRLRLFHSRAGRKTGFLFAWAQLWVVRPGNIGLLAYVFADYANRLWPIGQRGPALVVYATTAVLVLSGINILGVREGKWTQNLLTAVKVLGCWRSSWPGCASPRRQLR